MTETKFFVLNKEIIKEFGADAALLLSEIALWQDMSGDWVFRTQAQIEEETGIKSKIQKKCVELLKNKGILKTKKQGLPARLYYLIDEKQLTKFIQNGQTSLAKIDKQESQKEIMLVSETAKHKNNNNKNNKLKINIEDCSKILKELILSYIEYRKEIKKPFKSQKSIDTKIAEFLSQSQKYGEEAVVESIQQAISNGWQGTFIDKKYLQPINQKTYEPKNQQQTLGSFIQRATDFEL